MGQHGPIDSILVCQQGSIGKILVVQQGPMCSTIVGQRFIGSIFMGQQRL